MSTFTIPYPEYDIARILQERFSKKDEYSVAIPLSRQQKFYDLALINGATRKMVTIQVKSSRTWHGNKKAVFKHYSWQKNFDITNNYSDYYCIYMTYPHLDKQFRPRGDWKTKILVFTQSEMKTILASIKTKSGKKGGFFSFGFNDTGKVCLARSSPEMTGADFSKNLLENKLEEIRKRLS